MIGRTVSHYRILSELGSGGMGVVYKAEDLKLKRTVALKFLHPEMTRDEEAKGRFIHEAQAAAALNHPHIGTIYEIDEYDGQSFIAMEFVEGESLKDRIQRRPLPIDDLLSITIQIAEGLHEAHEKGIVHRDIKPGNIMLTPRGQAKILDFGLARLGADTKITKTGTTLGTPAYMSPEQATGKEVDRRSDIWALGVVLYEMVTGARPFTGEYEPAVVYSILHAEPEPVTSRRSQVPMELERIVGKALAKDASERYPHVEDMLADLKALRRQTDSGSRSVATIPAAHLRRPRAWKSVALVVAAIILLIASSVGATILFSRSSSTGHDRAGPAKPTCAVMNFENRVGEARFDRYGQGATELLTVDLARGLTNVELVSSQRLFDLLRGMKQDLWSLDRTVATEIARRAGARFMIRGEILELAGSVIMKTEVIEVDGGRLIAAQRINGITDANLLDKIDELGRQMREDMKGLL